MTVNMLTSPLRTDTVDNYNKYLNGIEGEVSDQRLHPLISIVSGSGAGGLANSVYDRTGVETYIHESAHKAMVHSFYKNANVTVQVDGIDNVKNYIADPTSENFKKIIDMYDANQDGGAGVTSFNYGAGPRKIGEIMGAKGNDAVISAAGCASTEAISFLLFGAGFKMRKKNPVAAYALMTTAGLNHISNSLYVISAMMPGPKIEGHDWEAFAKDTGVPASLTALLFSLSLPALGLGMYFTEKAHKEKLKRHFTVSKLIKQNQLKSEVVSSLFEKYPKRAMILGLENQLNTYLSDMGKKDPGETSKILKKLMSEYAGFTDYLIKNNIELVENEKQRLFPEEKITATEKIKKLFGELKTTFKNEPGLTIFSGAGILGGIITAICKSFGALNRISGSAGTTSSFLSAGGNILKGIIAPLGLMGAVGVCMKALKTLKDPKSTIGDKVTAGAFSGFSILGAASMFIPQAVVPLSLISVGGMFATLIGNAMINSKSKAMA